MRRALALFLLAGLAVPAGADAYHFQSERHRWETERIPYWVSSSSLRVPVARATGEWNALGLRVRLVRAASRRAAFVTFRGDGPRDSCAGGVTQVLGARQADGFRYIARARVAIARGCSLNTTVFITAHEIGHVLGMGHETRRCALMNPAADAAGQSRQCPRRSPGARARDPLRSDDLAGIRALYRRPLRAGPLAAYEQFIPF